MTKKESAAKLRSIKRALESFPAEVRRQERAHREDVKIKKAFGKINLNVKKRKAARNSNQVSPLNMKNETVTDEEKVHHWMNKLRKLYKRLKT